MKKYLLVAVILFLWLPAFCKVKAAPQGEVTINEIAWMGTGISANDEWMELKNTTDQAINLEGWTLASSDGKLKINLKNSISAHGFYLLERSDDNSVPTMTADIIYTGALSNTGQHLLLTDSSGNIIDEANFLSKWPAGDNGTKQTMEKAALGWQTSQNPGGSPKAENGTRASASINSPVPAPTQANLSPTTSPPTIYQEGVIINEILPNPEGSDEANEWVELYNPTGTLINISGWKLVDTKGTPGSYVFPNNSILSSNQYIVLKRSDTKITLNNEEDGLNLLLPNEKITDAMYFTNAPLKQSYNRNALNWKWSSTPTPNNQNTITALALKKSTSALPKPKKTDSKYVAALAGPVVLAAASNPTAAQENTAANPWLLFLIALAIIIIFAITILIITFKPFASFFKNKNEQI